MGFKTDTSFLRFLTMGAVGVRQTMARLQALDFTPIELERYCGSNKIWMTKVKRLRLPDVLCVRTGVRFEVRAKSDLKIRMSDAPNNPERTWDAKLRDDDIAAFIAVTDEGGVQRPAENPVFFTIGALRQSAAQSKLGPAKSASEGAERDRTWPAIIPSCAGTVQSVTPQKLVVEMRAGGRTRRQTYTLNGKHVYVRPGDEFEADVCILAGAPAAVVDLTGLQSRAYDPMTDLSAIDPVDRYSAVKALRFRQDLRDRALPALESLLNTEADERVRLEAAGAVAALDSRTGEESIRAFIQNSERPDLRMEAVLILSELKSSFGRKELVRIANDKRFEGDEIRQAAVWGLGKAGHKAYRELLSFISDPEENVALHAIVAFGMDTPDDVIQKLIAELLSSDPRRAPAASEALRLISSDAVVRHLVKAAEGRHQWVLATLGRSHPDLVEANVDDSDLRQTLAPMLLLRSGANWLASEDRVMDIAFLAKQIL